MSETPEESKQKELENQSFDALKEILSVAMEKFRINNKKDTARLKWARLAIQAISAAGQLKYNQEVLKLKQKVDQLAEGLKINLDYGIPTKDPRDYVQPLNPEALPRD